MARFLINQPSDLVKHYRHRAEKRFGQHFLVDPNILNHLIDAAGVEPGNPVLEIGPGCGTLTWALLERGAAVTAVELERNAAAFLRDVVEFEGEFELIEADVLELDVDELLDERSGRWSCVSNLPYGAATEIYFHLAGSFERFDRLVLMFQREVAERMVATAGDEAFGALSVMAQVYADLEIVQRLAPGAFTPPPKVHSAALRVEPIPGTRLGNKGAIDAFRRTVRTAFRGRRKILPNALGPLDVPKEVIEEAIREAGLDRDVRPERVEFEQWEALVERLGPRLDGDEC